MTSKRISLLAAAVIAFILGGLFGCAFLIVNDPDEVAIETITQWKWFILCPVTFVIGLCMSANAWLGGVSTLIGTFLGTCIMAIMHKSNIWPIAAVFWTALWFFPVVVGSLAGGLFGWGIRKMWNK